MPRIFLLLSVDIINAHDWNIRDPIHTGLAVADIGSNTEAPNMDYEYFPTQREIPNNDLVTW